MPDHNSIEWYRSKNGAHCFRFSFEEQDDGSWLAFIVQSPDYGSRDCGLHVTHRLKDQDRHYVCWSEPLDTLAECKAVAAKWADLTSVYVLTGKTIDEEVAGK